MAGTYSQFNGWNIIPMPSSPVAKQITFTANDSVGQTQSPFTMQTQTQQWPGADYWEAEVSLPPMTRAQAGAWIAFLMSLRGKANVFQMGDPVGLFPQGSFTGIPGATGPFANGTHAPMATTLNVKGMNASVNGILLPGDFLQIGYRLHVVAGVWPINTDASGNAAIEIWPSLRDTVADGSQVFPAGALGLWRLADNKRAWSITEAKLFGISFKAVEAR